MPRPRRAARAGLTGSPDARHTSPAGGRQRRRSGTGDADPTKKLPPFERSPANAVNVPATARGQANCYNGLQRARNDVDGRRARAALATQAGCAAWSGSRLYASVPRARVGHAARDRRSRAGRPAAPGFFLRQNHWDRPRAPGRQDAALAAYRRAVALDCRNEAAARNLRGAEGQLAPAPAASLGSVSP
jgi:hypothetical protein